MSNSYDLCREVIDKKLCCFCGTCVGICPTNAIGIDKEMLTFKHDKCISCSQCLSVCPGESFDYKKYNMYIFNKDQKEVSNDIGFYREIYKGYSTRPDIYAHVSSGGLATAIAVHLLEQGVIDGSIGIKSDKDDPTVFKPAILATTEEIIAAAGSKYALIPTNIVIKEILKHTGKFLFVGLPCQIQGLRKAIMKNPTLKKKIYITISLFCGFNMEFKATELLIKKSKIEKPQELHYRASKNNKSGFLIRGNGNEEFFIDKHGYTILNMFFTPERCWKCYDLTGEFADISLGDAWEMEKGSRIITRTERGQAVINDMVRRGLVFVDKSNENDINTTQSKLIRYKKYEIALRSKRLENFPNYSIEFTMPNVKEQMKAEIFLYFLRFGRSRIGRTILSLLPIKLVAKISTILRKAQNDRDSINELIRYGFWGFITVVFSLFSFYFLSLIGFEYKISNLVSIVLTKIVAYLTNKFFVFKSKKTNISELLLEVTRYIIARGFVGLVDFIGLIIFVEALGISKMIGKIIMLVITTILNFFLGKKHVFK